MGLEDMAADNTPVRSSGYIAGLRRSAEESRARNTSAGGEEWAAAIKARGVGMPLKMDQRSSVRVVLLDKGYPLLAHAAVTKWVSKGQWNFPAKENVRCSGLVSEPDGSWKPTGKLCPWCMFTGREPRLIIIWAGVALRPLIIKEVKKAPVTPCRVEVADGAVQSNIWDGVTVAARRDRHEETTVGALFNVTRSAKDKSVSYGDSWTFDKWIPPADLAPYLKGIPNYEMGWPIFSDEIIMAMIERHKKIADDHALEDLYSRDGYARLTGKATLLSPIPNSTGSLEDMAAGMPATSAEPALDELPDLPPWDGTDSDDAPTADGSPPGDFDPWNDIGA